MDRPNRTDKVSCLQIEAEGDELGGQGNEQRPEAGSLARRHALMSRLGAKLAVRSLPLVERGACGELIKFIRESSLVTGKHIVVFQQ